MQVMPEESGLDMLIHEFGGATPLALVVVALVVVVGLVVALVVRECRRPGRHDS